MHSLVFHIGDSCWVIPEVCFVSGLVFSVDLYIKYICNITLNLITKTKCSNDSDNGNSLSLLLSHFKSKCFIGITIDGIIVLMA